MSSQFVGQTPSDHPTIEEETPPLPPTDLPYDDGEPLESNRDRIAMNVLIDSLHQAYQGRDDYFAGGEYVYLLQYATSEKSRFSRP
ncbi:hypothetical protein PN462_02135 [Spirulina sp. CS-785/01]|nr:hypothetical protein [Spirulina sp. CS-785/01]MDB9311885.1 hypothetical protein [Spirulina sp. CS-785/01]